MGVSPPAPRSTIPAGRLGNDAHDVLDRVNADKQANAQLELVPFRAAIGGRQGVMTAHTIYLPTTKSCPPPSPALARILTGLCEGELGFDGVIVSDAIAWPPS